MNDILNRGVRTCQYNRYRNGFKRSGTDTLNYLARVLLYQEMQTVMIRRSDRLRIFAARSPPISASGSMLKPVTSWELREHPCSSGLRPSATNPSGTPNTTAFQQVYSCGLGVRSSSTSPAGSPARCTKPSLEPSVKLAVGLHHLSLGHLP